MDGPLDGAKYDSLLKLTVTGLSWLFFGITANFIIQKFQGKFFYGYFLLKFQEDEEAFEMFSVYCGLALHHAKLYDKIRRSEQKYKGNLNTIQFSFFQFLALNCYSIF